MPTTPIEIYISIETLQTIYPGLDQTQLSLVADSLSLMIDQYCGTTFGVGSHVEKLDEAERLVPQFLPIISVLELSRTIEGETTILVENVDFYVYSDHIYLVNPGNGRKSLTLSYSYGYGYIPEIVKRVAEELAKYYKDSSSVSPLFSAQRFDDSEYRRFNKDERAILGKLDLYRVGRRSGRIKVGYI